MKALLRLALGLPILALAVGCEPQSPTGSINDWTNVKSGWGEKNSYDASAPQAQQAWDFYQAYSAASGGVRWGWWFNHTLDCSGTGAAYSSTLYAGQTINAGTVTVSNDATNLYVNITGTGGWLIQAAHVYAGTDPIPLNSAGNPAPGSFPWQQTYTPQTASATFTIPLSSIPAACGDQLNVAVHTETVQLDASGNVTESETGWAHGPFTFDDSGTSGGGGGGGGTSGGCPTWMSSLSLNVSMAYAGNTGYLSSGWPIFHLGDTVQAALTICNPGTNGVTNLTITSMEELYGSGVLLGCSSPVQTWSGVAIAAGDCITLNYSFFLSMSCPYGNYQSHIMIARDADQDCPSAIQIYDDPQVGVYDPPAEG